MLPTAHRSPSKELNPAEPDAGAGEGEPDDLTDVEVEPEEVAADASSEGAAPAATISDQSQEGQEAQQDQVEEEVGAGDAAPAEDAQQEEESDTVADFAPEGAASGAPEEFPLTTGDFCEAELAEGDEAAVADAEADVRVSIHLPTL